MFAVNKPIAHRPNVKEQDSRGKNTFLVVSFMSFDSLAELRTNVSTQILFCLTESHKSSVTTKLRCSGPNCLSPQRPDKFYGQGMGKVGPRALEESICVPRSPEWYQ